MIERRDFTSREALAEALAATIRDRLAEAIADRGAATLAVSGGTTPRGMLKALSREPLDWSKVTVTLVDERFVPMDTPRSNARLVRETLLEGPANAAKFLPLYSPEASAEEAAAAADSMMHGLPLPFDAVILGMGADGHTASFFPDAASLDDLLDPAASRIVLAVDARSAGEPRITLTLPAIVSARFIALHIEGAEKAGDLWSGLAPRSGLPIRRVLDAAQTPVEIFWAA